MIITCNNCQKKFEIDQGLIPENGRLLQCSSCNHKWFFKKKVDNKIEKTIKSTKNDVVTENLEKILENNEYEKNDDYEGKTTDIIKDDNNKKERKKFKILNITIVFLISFIALIILIDTFKYPISKIVPNIEFILYNLYESIKDIRLFLKDLI
tara:strand:+ start:118 stop:576 length:459 start_codon:yes stop_codon:yes gene_type:complete